MPPLLRLACARSFRPLHTLLRIHTEDQPERHLIAVRQLHYHIRDLARIAFRTSFEAPQQLDHRTDRGFIVRQQIWRILPCAPRPVGPNAAWLQRADLDPERRDLHRQSVAETAHGPLGRVIWRIAAVRDPATYRRHLKERLRVAFPEVHPSAHGQLQTLRRQRFRPGSVSELRFFWVSIVTVPFSSFALAPPAVLARRTSRFLRRGSSAILRFPSPRTH